MFGLGKPKELTGIMIYTTEQKDWQVLEDLATQIPPKILSKPFGLTGASTRDGESAIFPLKDGGYLRVGFINKNAPLSKAMEVHDGFVFAFKDVPKRSPVSDATVEAVYLQIVEFLTEEVKKRAPNYPSIRCSKL
jgi:hypothetical protein